MGKFRDLTGQKFGRLTVIDRAPDRIYKDGKKRTMWNCVCDCEEHNHVVVSLANLTSGGTKSCGCLKKETSANNGKKYKGISNLKNKKYNEYDLDSKEYGIGYTSNTNKPFLFDKEDYEKIYSYCWWENDSGYLIATVHNGTNIRMHRLIMDEENPHVKIDHINHNTLDNRKCNLRCATNAQNAMNGTLRSTNTSGVTGVSKKRNKWHARICVDYKEINLGFFDNFEDAVAVRKEAEEKYFGEFSYDNSMKIADNVT